MQFVRGLYGENMVNLITRLVNMETVQIQSGE